MLKNLACLKEVCIFLCFICLCCVKEVSTDMLEEQVLEERDLYLNEEEGIPMEYSREEHWRDVAEGGENKRIFFS